MLQEELKTIKVGDQVGVARSGSWHVMSEGIYTVEKSDKVKIVVTRGSDGYQRTLAPKPVLKKVQRNGANLSSKLLLLKKPVKLLVSKKPVFATRGGPSKKLQRRRIFMLLLMRLL